MTDSTHTSEQLRDPGGEIPPGGLRSRVSDTVGVGASEAASDGGQPAADAQPGAAKPKAAKKKAPAKKKTAKKAAAKKTES